MLARVGPRAFPSRDPEHLLVGIRRPVSFLGYRGIQHLSIFLQQFAPYFSIS